ncbi:thiol:disulfide interchange protein precursor [Polystyrenella longa]|uniref:Thiol:disulfide interchange protein n=1 Tax=Polystyrenella longa TaxID=2528007 RepID=A0A518CJN4_9PLAN|nr:thioredoxin family protein [Polystyrenella longa]QDU79446.1 thiol:disulfide interchange protein precursor [Polystyrenella longa]
MIPSLVIGSLLLLSSNLYATEMAEASLKHFSSTSKIEWQHDLGPAQEIAETNNRPLLLFFTATWCGPCQSVKRTTMQDPSVIRELSKNFVPVMLDFDQHRFLASQMNISVVPTIMVLNPSATGLLHKVTNTSGSMFIRELQTAKKMHGEERTIKKTGLSR